MKSWSIVLVSLALFAVPTTLVAQQATPAPSVSADMMNAVMGLIPALKATPGCLGVETGSAQSGKQMIFAWFENKKALQAWYYSELHTKLMAFAESAPRTDALSDLPDDTPIMAIASLTPPKGGQLIPSPGSPVTLPQISIELYAPLPGGAGYGGRFSPATLHVPGFRTLTN